MALALRQLSSALENYAALQVVAPRLAVQFLGRVPTVLRIERGGIKTVVDLRTPTQFRASLLELVDRRTVLEGLLTTDQVQALRDEVEGKVSADDLRAIAAWRLAADATGSR